MKIEELRRPVRISMVVILLAFTSFVVANIFWHQELKYNLPTPKPTAYKEVAIGSTINLGGNLQFNNGKPTLVHFYNPNCPCSKFNLQHVNQLMRSYGAHYNFAVVVCHRGNATAESLTANFEPGVELSFDTTVMAKCGVYSTPQAIILNNQNQLYYRGNYNKSRYCTTPETNYVQIAMQALLQNQNEPHFDKQATVAYGCQTEYCTLK